MKILIAADYYGLDSFNGMAIYSASLVNELRSRGIEVFAVSLDNKNDLHPPLLTPMLKEFVLDENNQKIKEWMSKLDDLNIDKVFVMSEETVGVNVRQWALSRNKELYTLYSTKYPEFFEARGEVPPSHQFFKWFHSRSKKIIVPTLSVKYELLSRYYPDKIEVMEYGTDTSKFKPGYPAKKDHEYLLYIGRLAKEKNILALTPLNTYGMPLYVIGTGPMLSTFQELTKENKNIQLVGPADHGFNSASWYSGARAMIFPSKLDTFGLTITESLCCGTPVAAFDAPGPRDILTDERLGHIDDNLQHSLDQALIHGDGDFCSEYASEKYSMKASADRFLKIITT